MAFDYKTLQAMAESQARNATSGCPECGRPWTEPLLQRPRWEPPFPWRTIFLGVVGLFLAITLGHRTVSLVEAGDSPCPTPRETQTCHAPTARPVCCALSSLSPDDWFALGASVGQSAMAEGEIRRDLLLTVGGLATVLVGIGALLRQRLRTRANRRQSVGLGAWAMGETLWGVASLQVLALYADLVIVRLSLGGPYEWWVALDAITDQVSALFSIITGS